MSASRIRRYLRNGTASQLMVFDAIVRLGSFTRAAEELHMAQPTVSAQVRKLSEAIGLPLFEQIGKRVYPTQAGLHLQAACAEVFGAFERMEDALGDLRGLTGGRLQLAVGTTGKYFVPRLLAGFSRRYPGIDISLRIHNRRALLERFEANEDDLYIFSNPPQANAVTQMIQPNWMVVFAPADHPLARQRRIPFARLAREPFLMREAGSGTRMVAEREFARRGLEPRVRMELSTNEAIKQAIVAGLGISILSRDTLGVGTEVRELATLDVEGFPLESSWSFAYPVGKQVQAPARAFMDFVRAESGALAEVPLMAA